LNTQDFLQQLSFERIDVSFAIVVGLSMIFAFIFLFDYFSKVKRTEAQAVISNTPGISIIVASRNARWINSEAGHTATHGPSSHHPITPSRT
jgi:hypothetical protein